MSHSSTKTTRSISWRIALAFALLSAALFALIPARADAAAASSDYIVLYESGAGLSKKIASEEARGNDVQEVFRSAAKGYVASLDSADVARLRAQDGVLLVEKDKPVEALSAGPRSGLAASWGLDRIDQRTLPLNSLISTDQNGFGVTAYIIDTGIRADHAQFGGRVTAGFDAIGDGQNTNDCNGHGTHVAGTVGGSTYGVAPEVSLVAVRVLSCSGSGSTSGVIAGINWATANHVAGVPAVANMSLGGGFSSALNTATQNAISDGITFAVAAGNSNADACSSSPASTPNALTVGSTASNDARSSFSNWGTCLDVFAPGSAIASAWNTSPTATNTISGTSMAAPHVAGAAALRLSANPSSTPAQVGATIAAAATTGVVTDPHSGSPDRLLFTGESDTPSPPPPPAPPAPTPPANDNFDSAPALTSFATVTGTTIAATHESGEPAHVNAAAGSAASIWYTWTATADGTLALNTQGSNFDTLLAVYSGSSLTALTPVASNDDSGGGGLWSSVSFPVTAGTTYRIAVDGWHALTGTTSLSGGFIATPLPPPTEPIPPPTEPPPPPAPAPAPANDNFASATALSSLDHTTGTTVSATHEENEPSHVHPTLGSSASTWYTWTAAEDGSLELKTEGSSYDTLLAVYTGDALDALTPKAGNDDANYHLWSRVTLAVTSGTTYRIAIDGWRGARGTTVISGTFTPKAPTTPPTPTPPPTEPTPPPAPAPPDPEPVVPDTRITEAPPTSTTNTRPTFSFVSSIENSDFECQMEGRGWDYCTSPFQPETALSNGFHSFAVRATSPDGLTDATPASVAFTVQAPAATPTDPPTITPGVLTPTSTTLSALGRTATLSITCVPASASASSRTRVRVNDTDGPCRGRLRLTTSRSTSQRTVNLTAGQIGNVSFAIDARTARTLNAGTAVRATLRVTQGTSSRLVTVTLRKLSTSARSRLLGRARR